MITTNENSKVSKLGIEVPEFESFAGFSKAFAKRFNFSRLAVKNGKKKIEVCEKTNENRKKNRSKLSKKYIKFLLFFLFNSNNLREKGRRICGKFEKIKRKVLSTQSNTIKYTGTIYIKPTSL
jgi:hypothetical protein